MLIIPFAHNHNSLCLWSYRYHDSLRFQEPAPDVLQNWTWPRSDPSNVTSRLESCVVRSLLAHSNLQEYFSIEITIGLFTKTSKRLQILFIMWKGLRGTKTEPMRANYHFPRPCSYFINSGSVKNYVDMIVFSSVSSTSFPGLFPLKLFQTEKPWEPGCCFLRLFTGQK